jgi:ribonucleoside-triphosphate reductase
MTIIRDIKESPWQDSGKTKNYWKKHIDFELDEDTKKLIRESKEQDFSLQATLTFFQNYSRTKEDGTSESWADTVIRVTEGTMYLRKHQMFHAGRKWVEETEQKFARLFATHMFDRSFLPAGRGLWAMDKKMVKDFPIALYNCSFASPAPDSTTVGDKNLSFAYAAQWMMMVLMLGAGIAYDCEWHGSVYLPSTKEKDAQFYKIDDSREGWAFSLYLLMESYLLPDKGVITFDCSGIRKRGEPIKRFGGTAGGPESLILMHKSIRSYFECFYRVHTENMSAKDSIRKMMFEMREYDPQFASKFDEILVEFEAVDADLKTYNHTRLIVDILNTIPRCVMDGGLGRSSALVFSGVDDEEFQLLKNDDTNPERRFVRNMSNNSICADTPEDYAKIAKILPPLIKEAGEPGVFNRFLARCGMSRHADPRLKRVRGTNACSEVLLEGWEFCNLASAILQRCMNPDGTIDYKKLRNACMLAAFYTAIVACNPLNEARAEAVRAENLRVAVSLDASFVGYEMLSNQEFGTLLKSCKELIITYVDAYTMAIAGKKSVTHTCFKPGGKIPPLADSLSSINGPICSQYVELRRIIHVGTPIYEELVKIKFPLEPYPNNDNMKLAVIPMNQGPCRSTRETSFWERGALQAMLQRMFSDNSLSTTIDFPVSTSDIELEHFLGMYLWQLKGICFLPYEDFRTLKLLDGNEFRLRTSMSSKEAEAALESMKSLMSPEEYARGLAAKFEDYEWHPYTPITKEQYDAQMAALPTFSTGQFCKRKHVATATETSTAGCDGNRCVIVPAN